MYFKNMPNITYNFNGEQKVVKDIFRRVALKDGNKPRNRVALSSYYVTDGETPEILADKFYGNARYHWVILLSNAIVNVHKEWPKDQQSLFDYVEHKYGSGNAQEVHHYVVTDTEIVVDYDAAKLANGEISIVTNYDYENEENESKRQIFILKNEYLKDFVSNYKKLIVK